MPDNRDLCYIRRMAAARIVKKTEAELAKLSDTALEAYIRKLDEKARPLCDELIAAGRGRETAQETWKKTDPLSLRWRAAAEARYVAGAHRDERRRLGSKYVRDRALRAAY